MPVKRCPNGKYRIGENGPCIYKSKASAERAYAAYLAKTSNEDIDIEIDDAPYLNSLDDDELHAFQHHVGCMCEQAQADADSPMHEGKIPKAVQFDTSSHFRKVNKAAIDLEKGRIDRATFQTRVKKVTFDSYESAYAKGKGVKVSDLTDGDREYLRRAVETELGYLDGFADDLEAGTVGKGPKWSRAKRVQAYSDTVEGIAWHGNVEKNAPPGSGVLIYWRLSPAHHCESCLLLASASPFERETLPTTPKAGSTECRSRCLCFLEYKAGKKDATAAAELEYKRDATLSELMKPPVSPGTRRPNDIEQRHIDNLRTKMNFQRRRIAKEQEAVRNAKTKEARAVAQDRLREAISLRKGYNRQLNEFAEKNDIFEVPVFSVDDVITEKDIGRRARRDIARHGIDGSTLSALDAKALSRLLTGFEEQVGTNLSDVAIGKAIGEAVEVKKAQAPKRVKFIAAPYALRGKSDRVDYNLVGEDLQHTFWLLAKAAQAAVGTGVVVGPFDDAVLARVGLWVDGEPDEVEEVFKRMRND